MSGKLKEVRLRIKSVQSTQQITKAMKMVSAAKLRKAQDAITRMRPYAENLSEVLGHIVANSDGSFSLELAEAREIKKVLLVEITADRGLCGAFNSNLNKTVLSRIHGPYKAQADAGNVHLLHIGKKGFDFFKRFSYEQNITYKDLLLDLNFDDVAAAAEFLIEKFLDGTYDKIEIIYAQFKNAATQSFVSENFLPIEPITSEDSESTATADFIFEPDRQEIMEALIPKILKTQVYKAILDSNASEHGARMTSMDKATENAGELLKDLRLTYNRARQAAITTELTEIVSGANALEAG